jgi:hypothetical protein
MPVLLVTVGNGSIYGGYTTWVRGPDLQTRKAYCDLPQVPTIRNNCWPRACREVDCNDRHLDLRDTPFFCLKIATYPTWVRGYLLYYLVLKISASGDVYERFGIGYEEGAESPGFFTTAKITTIKIV